MKFTSQKTCHVTWIQAPNSDSLIPLSQTQQKGASFPKTGTCEITVKHRPPKIMNMQHNVHIHNRTANKKNNKIASMQIYPITTRENLHVILGSWIITWCNRPTYSMKLLFAMSHLVARKSLSNNDSAICGEQIVNHNGMAPGTCKLRYRHPQVQGPQVQGPQVQAPRYRHRVLRRLFKHSAGYTVEALYFSEQRITS